jgi:uncharacterized C2H2 Zn-finger protein
LKLTISGVGRVIFPTDYILGFKMFKCPLCGGMRRSLLSLRLHVRKGHGEIWGRCPICNRELKCAVVHYRRVNDDKHRELWILTVSPRNSEGSIRRIAGEYALGVKYGMG